MYLGIDCGTQSTKAILVDDEARVHGRGSAAHALIERPDGTREQYPHWWVEGLRVAVRQAVGDHGAEVHCIGVSGQQHGLVVLDASGEVIRPAKLWNDTSTAPQNAELVARFGGAEAYQASFGVVPLTGYTVSKLLWLAEREPAAFARVRRILLPHDYLNFYLTGELVAEPGDASGTGFYDPRTREWKREVLDSIDGGTGQLFAALPALISSDAIVGRILRRVADELGISRKCVVSAGGGDNMMGAIGTGNVNEGVVTMSLGTSATVFRCSTQPMQHASEGVASFCSSTGGWLPLVCTMNATNVTGGMLDLLGKEVADIDAALDVVAPGADGLTMLPFLNGERTPDLPDARGSVYGISSTNFTVAHMIRAAVEGVTFGILNGLAAIAGDRAPASIRLIGGGARSRAWRQLLGDAAGLVVQTPVEEEAACLGAAIQAMVAYSRITATPITFDDACARFVAVDEARGCWPDEGRAKGYRQAHARYNEWLQKMYPTATASSRFEPARGTIRPGPLSTPHRD